jgi:hypothetical protein
MTRAYAIATTTFCALVVLVVLIAKPSFPTAASFVGLSLLIAAMAWVRHSQPQIARHETPPLHPPRALPVGGPGSDGLRVVGGSDTFKQASIRHRAGGRFDPGTTRNVPVAKIPLEQEIAHAHEPV